MSDRSYEDVQQLHARVRELEAENATLRPVVRDLAASYVLAIDPVDRRFHCALCGKPIWSADDHADDCLWRQAVELSARMAPGWDAKEGV